MGPSMTKGATIPAERRPATNVVVFQCPCGTLMRNRWPRGALPLARAIFVVAPGSSMNTRRSGSGADVFTLQSLPRNAKPDDEEGQRQQPFRTAGHLQEPLLAPLV